VKRRAVAYDAEAIRAIIEPAARSLLDGGLNRLLILERYEGIPGFAVLFHGHGLQADGRKAIEHPGELCAAQIEFPYLDASGRGRDAQPIAHHALIGGLYSEQLASFDLGRDVSRRSDDRSRFAIAVALDVDAIPQMQRLALAQVTIVVSAGLLAGSNRLRNLRACA
jgi:hypothetical protein